MKFSELDPQLSPDGGEYRELSFKCPRCQSHRLMIDVWVKAPAEERVKLNGDLVKDFYQIKRLWQFKQTAPGWETVTVSPSINRQGRTPPDPCGGWHGFITNGQVT